MKWLFLGSRGIRSGWRILMFIAIALLMSGTVLLGASAIWRSADIEVGQTWDSVYTVSMQFLLLLSLLASSYIMVRLVDTRSCASFGYSFDSGWFTEVLFGTATGFFAISSIIVIGFTAGTYSLAISNFDTVEAMKSLAGYAMLIFIFAMIEEVFFRGYIFQTLIEGTGKIAAVLILSMIFGFAHYFNPHGSLIGAMNTGLAGALLSITYIRTRSLWLPSSIHFSWNFTLGYVFGGPVSGVRLENTPVMLRISGEEFVSGGEFGPEASIIAMIVLVILILCFMMYGGVKPTEAMRKRWETYHEKSDFHEKKIISN